jgi:CRP/FNR family transcriptional regulator, cyclic AMP receptor protein
MESLEPILAKHAFFEGLEPKHLKLLVGCASNERFPAASYLFRQGEEASHFYLIRQGRVALEIYAPHRPSIVIETLDGDDILGWSWLIPPYLWRFDARIVEPTRAIALDGKCLRAKCEEDHDLGYELMKRFAHIVTQRLQATRMQLLDVYAVHD